MNSEEATMTDTPKAQEKPWMCACGETDITKHDLGMVIAHEYELPEEKGLEILLRMRDRLGIIGDNE